MELNELLQKLLEAEVAKAAPKEETPAAPAAAAAPLTADALRAIIAEEVAKAAPAPQRPEGEGSRAEASDVAKAGTKAGADKETQAMVELVKKAASTNPDELTPAEKRAIWAVTYRALSAGLKKDDSVE